MHEKENANLGNSELLLQLFPTTDTDTPSHSNCSCCPPATNETPSSLLWKIANTDVKQHDRKKRLKTDATKSVFSRQKHAKAV